MKKTIKTLLIIAAICGGVGILLIGIGVATGATMGDFSRETQKSGLFQKLHVNFGNWDSDEEWDASQGQIRQEYDAKEVKKLEITLNAGELELLNSDSDQIVVELSGMVTDNDVELKDGTLLVEDHSNYKLRDADCVQILVYLPYDLKLEELDLTVHAGAASSQVDQITAETISLEVDAGELIAGGRMDAKQDAEITVGAGQIELDELSARTLDVECGIGEIALTADCQGDVTVSCGVGEVDLTLYGQEDSYDYELDCGIGEMQVGSSSYSGMGSSRIVDHGAEKKLEAECGVGQLTVRFLP